MMKNRIPTTSFVRVRKCQKSVPVIADKFKDKVMTWPRSAEALVKLKSLDLKTTELHEFAFEADSKLETPVTCWGIVNKDGAIRSEDGTYVAVGKKAEPKAAAPTPAKAEKPKAEPKPKQVKEKATAPEPAPVVAPAAPKAKKEKAPKVEEPKAE